MKTVTIQGCCVQGLQNKKLSDDDAPSAPPLAGSVQEFNQVAEELLNFRGSGTPCPGSSTSSAITDEANVAKRVSLGSTMDDSTANRISDPPLRTGFVSSSSVPTHFPTFHASGLGPWHAVISYDACVRLCLHSWARGCREAPIFLENECQLLRNAFGAKSENGFRSTYWLQFLVSKITNGTRYLKEVSGLLKTGVSTFHNSSSSYEVVQETYSCSLRLKSLSEEDAVRMQPGSGETHVFFPDGLGDDLVIEVFDSKGRHYGHVVAQVADIADDPGDKLRWWPMYHEPEHEMVGRIQLSINYSTNLDENSNVKCGSVAETVAYNMVLEAALKKAQHFCQRNLLLHGSWRWLLTEFALFYGVSDAYTKLRYLSYVMDVAIPTADCLYLVHDLLSPVIKKDNIKCRMSHQENRILGEVSDQIEQAIALVFENYKSLDESSPSGMMDIFRPATNVAAPALGPALKLYCLLHDICSSEAQLKLCRYFETAVIKRSRRSLAETDEFVSGNNEYIDGSSETFCCLSEDGISLLQH